MPACLHSPGVAAQTFSDLMTLVDLGHDRYRTSADVVPGERVGPPRLFGGQVAAQALAAAARTVGADRPAHSVHCSFLGQGRPDRPIELSVERVRDGRSFTNREVVAGQDGRHILTLVASFHAGEPGPDVAAPVPSDSPDPDEIVELDTRVAPVWGPHFDLRVLPVARELAPFAPAIRFWARSVETLPEDPVIGACALVDVTDMHSARAAAVITGEQELQGPLTSLDHCVWLHRPAAPNAWFLVDARPVSTASSRGLVLGTVHTRSGVHVATFAQEVLVRRPGPRP